MDTPDRHGAPEGIDFDTVDEVVTLQGSVRSTVLDNGTMPVGGGLSEDELTLLDDLLTCGLPE